MAFRGKGLLVEQVLLVRSLNAKLKVLLPQIYHHVLAFLSSLGLYKVCFIRQKCEDSINSFPNFKTAVEYDGTVYQIHFLALFSQKSDAVPVMSIHGWPGD